MKSIRLTISGTEVEQHADGKWYYKVLKRETFEDEILGFTISKKDPPWWAKYLELLNKDPELNDFDAALLLKEMGYMGKQGRRLTESSIRSKKWAKRKGTQ